MRNACLQLVPDRAWFGPVHELLQPDHALTRLGVVLSFFPGAYLFELHPEQFLHEPTLLLCMGGHESRQGRFQSRRWRNRLLDTDRACGPSAHERHRHRAGDELQH